MFQLPLSRSAIGLAGALLIGLAPCAASAQAPTPTVTVLTAQPIDYTLTARLPGRIKASTISEVRPQVSGIIRDRQFDEGTEVEAGQPLYQIEDESYAAAAAAARAGVAQAQANYELAEREAKRAEDLFSNRTTSAAARDAATAARDAAAAALQLAEAQLQSAEIDRERTTIRAPISGVIGFSQATPGSLVAAQQVSPLTVIRTLDPVYVDVTQSASELFALRRARDAGRLVMASENEARVQLIFDDGSEYPHPGRLLFSEASVDSTTGQITLRAEFPNPDDVLLPGLYVRARVEQAVRENALTIPQMAVQRDQSGQAYVYALKDADTVERRDVTLGQTTGNRWLVESGLEPGDKVVVAGAQKLYPDAKVVPQPVEAAGEKAEAETAPAVQEARG